jgi:hypothetical protein
MTDMTDNLQREFAATVRAMIEWSYRQPRPYITQKDAAPFVANLPEFWREPARIMATAGHYASADIWMRDNAE